jgi:hypothetical protein
MKKFKARNLTQCRYNFAFIKNQNVFLLNHVKDDLPTQHNEKVIKEKDQRIFTDSTNTHSVGRINTTYIPCLDSANVYIVACLHGKCNYALHKYILI